MWASNASCCCFWFYFSSLQFCVYIYSFININYKLSKILPSCIVCNVDYLFRTIAYYLVLFFWLHHVCVFVRHRWKYLMILLLLYYFILVFIVFIGKIRAFVLSLTIFVLQLVEMLHLWLRCVQQYIYV